MPQERNIFRSLTVEENMTAVAQPGPWTVAKVYEMFPRLKERRNNFGNQLSGGEQQMLAIGRALTLNPKVLLLDEPTEGLAPIIVEELLRALGTITRAGGICSIIVEQNAQKILGLADRVVILERGAIVHDAASAALKADPAVLERFLGVAGRRGTLRFTSRELMRNHAKNKSPLPRRRGRQPVAAAAASRKRAPGWRRARSRPTICARSRTWKSKRSCTSRPRSGLKLATDGEFRRSWWHFDFLAKLTGCELFHPDEGIQFAGVQTRHDAVRVIGKLDFPDDHPMLDAFQIPEKAMRHRACHAEDDDPVAGGAAFPRRPQVDLEGGLSRSRGVLSRISRKTYRKAVKAFYDAGCRYLQFDDTVWAYLCSQDELKKARERGDNPDGLQEIYARIINYAIAERPADMTITTHVCRGNFRSTWISSGGYEPVAETMLAGTNYDGYFLEYDSERAGGFEPLRYLPKGNKIVVVGVITSKSGAAGEKGRHQAAAGGSRANLRRSISSRYRRNAALPPPKKATSSPRKSSGRS